jgi:hypothetical protein
VPCRKVAPLAKEKIKEEWQSRPVEQEDTMAPMILTCPVGQAEEEKLITAFESHFQTRRTLHYQVQENCISLNVKGH